MVRIRLELKRKMYKQSHPLVIKESEQGKKRNSKKLRGTDEFRTKKRGINQKRGRDIVRYSRREKTKRKQLIF